LSSVTASLPVEIGQLRSLKRLVLSDNQLSSKFFFLDSWDPNKSP